MFRKALIAIVLLSACSAQSQDQIARQAARSTVSKVVAERLPGVPVQPMIDCVINNASSTQIYALAADGLTGPTRSTIEVVSDIIVQPSTVQCLSSKGLPALMARGGM
ncbi:hypothetical protein GCM10011415_33750 [Salipiger pallidus]|uniref:Succinate dehydrogenase n=1 Tax=Salipiger pallidus TaxID=1775170 RepID=A0A8J2ZMV0_9RHOB|nr:hypothetical protein [Salipiger pallidus]GGG81443.1 hypothetical protein GCM10011415_33750 [Salipiger pallidus]